MLTEASRGGHLTVANLLLRQPRIQQQQQQQSQPTSSVRTTKDHYERLKFNSGRKGHSRNGPTTHHHHHHHHQDQTMVKKAASVNEGPQTDQVL